MNKCIAPGKCLVLFFLTLLFLPILIQKYSFGRDIGAEDEYKQTLHALQQSGWQYHIVDGDDVLLENSVDNKSATVSAEWLFRHITSNIELPFQSMSQSPYTTFYPIRSITISQAKNESKASVVALSKNDSISDFNVTLSDKLYIKSKEYGVCSFDFSILGQNPDKKKKNARLFLMVVISGAIDQALAEQEEAKNAQAGLNSRNAAIPRMSVPDGSTSSNDPSQLGPKDTPYIQK